MSQVQKKHATNGSNKKKILMIVSNPATIKGVPVGFYAEELTTPFFEFTKAGHEIKLVSPKGGKVIYDLMSDPENESTQAHDDLITIGFNHHREYGQLLQNTPSIQDIRADEYDAVFVAGGGAPLITFKEDNKLHQLIAKFYEQGKFVATVCHASCLLLWTKLSNGDLLTKGKTWTGFSDAEERISDEMVGTKVFEETIESEAGKIPETTFEAGGPFEAFAIRDGRLITGQQQQSSFLVAKMLLEALSEIDQTTM